MVTTAGVQINVVALLLVNVITAVMFVVMLQKLLLNQEFITCVCLRKIVVN